MMYSYKSPLQDDEYREIYRQHERGPTPSHTGPSRPPHRPRQSPYPRPISDSQGPSYASRHHDAVFPQELNDMFGALECKLCCVESTSPVMAKMHYSGKQHMKKVKKYLNEWGLRTGKPVPSLAQNTSSPVTSLADYCELCDVRLLTTNDKMLHYTGKNHRKNEKDPANAKKKAKIYDTIDLSDARFGIGIGFTANNGIEAKPEEDNKIMVKIADFSCELCGVKAASEDQLNVHLNGKRHLEKLKNKEAGIPKRERPFKCDLCNVSLDTRYLFNLHLQGSRHAKELKKRDEESKAGGTCETCGITFSSFRDYNVHFSGKKHEKNVRQIALRTPMIKKEKKEVLACKSCPFVGDLDEHKCDKSLEAIKIEKTELDAKWKCVHCYNEMFNSEKEYEDHKKTRRHLLCMLNVEGDKISEENIHYYCFTCRKQCTDRTDYCNHLFSQNHMTLANDCSSVESSLNLWHCRVCSVLMDQQAKEQHQTSRQHLVTAAQLDLTRFLTQLATQELGTNTYHCTHCDLNFLSFVAFSEHMLNPQHLIDIIRTRTGLKHIV